MPSDPFNPSQSSPQSMSLLRTLGNECVQHATDEDGSIDVERLRSAAQTMCDHLIGAAASRARLNGNPVDPLLVTVD